MRLLPKEDLNLILSVPLPKQDPDLKEDGGYTMVRKEYHDLIHDQYSCRSRILTLKYLYLYIPSTAAQAAVKGIYMYIFF